MNHTPCSEDGIESWRRDPALPTPSWALPRDGILDAMEQVPLFMTRNPVTVEDNLTMSALQSLIYEGSLEEVASNFYENATEIYDDYMKTNCLHRTLLDNALKFLGNAMEQSHSNDHLKSKIFTLVGTIHFLKENCGKSKEYLKKALIHDGGNIEARKKLVDVLERLEQYREAIYIMEENPDGSSMVQFDHIQKKYEQMVSKERLKEADLRHKDNTLSSRYLKNNKEDFTLLDTFIPPQLTREIPSWTFDPEQDELYLPMVFLYPPYGTYDILSQVSEYSFLRDHIQIMFSEAAPWDSQNLYNPECLDAFLPFEDKKVKKISMGNTFHDIFLKLKSIQLYSGVLALFILPKNTSKQFLTNFRIVS